MDPLNVPVLVKQIRARHQVSFETFLESRMRPKTEFYRNFQSAVVAGNDPIRFPVPDADVTAVHAAKFNDLGYQYRDGSRWYFRKVGFGYDVEVAIPVHSKEK